MGVFSANRAGLSPATRRFGDSDATLARQARGMIATAARRSVAACAPPTRHARAWEATAARRPVVNVDEGKAGVRNTGQEEQADMAK